MSPASEPPVILLDRSPLGRLVAHEDGRTGADVLSLSLREPGSVRADVSRTLVCEWQPGPAFPAGGRIRLKVSVRIDAHWAADVARDGRSTCRIECDLPEGRRVLAASFGAGATATEGDERLCESSSDPQRADQRRSLVSKLRQTLGPGWIAQPVRVALGAALECAGAGSHLTASVEQAWAFEVTVEGRQSAS